MRIKRKKEKIRVQGSNYNKLKRENVYDAITWKPNQLFIFTVTMMVGKESEMNFLTIK